MPDYIEPVQHGYTLITLEGGHWIVREPIIAFDHCTQGSPWPITPSRGKVTGQCLVEYPDGRVYHRESSRVFDSQEEFEAEGEWAGAGAVAPNGEVVYPTLASLGLSGRATAPLERELGVITVGDLAGHERKVVAKVRGVSRDAVKEMDGWLAANGLLWGGGVPASGVKAVTEEDDEDDDDGIGGII